MKLFSNKKDNIKKPAIFVDRDGVLNKDKKGKYITKLNQVKIYKSALKGLKNISNYRLIIITNQSAIGRKYIALKDFMKINKFILDKFKKHGIKFDAFYYCPHTPEDKCNCRKPKIGLIKEAMKDLNIDLKNSFFIGDKETDIITAKNANLKSILVLTGQAREELKNNKIQPDFIIKDLRELKGVLK